MERAITFGRIVRERRGALGLTQAELARRASCAAVTIRKIEGDALRPSMQLAELLAAALNIPEEEQRAFVHLARQEGPLSPIGPPTPAPDEIGKENLSGRAVKGFHLAERIGSGGFGVVYRAVQPSVQRDVAVKIILPRFANHPTFIRRFEAEAHLVARLEHPHIVPLYDYWREPAAAYLIMRLLRGGNLESLLRQSPLPADLFRRIARQVGLAMAAAHAHGVVHRDIKPANVLLDEHQNAYLADFGIARYLDLDLEGDLLENELSPITPAYLSPEQLRNEPVQPASDIYSFGLLLFEMISGRQVYDGPTPEDYREQHLFQPIPSLLAVKPDLPPALDDLIRRAAAKKPEARFPDIETLLDRLDAVLDDGAVGAAAPASAAQPPLPLSVDALENPYRGLHPFAEADSKNFFGRETLVQELLAMLADGSDLERFAALIGPSGSGKSSAIRAGLLPALRRGGLPGSNHWFIVELTPGGQPWVELAAALQRVAATPMPDLPALLQVDSYGLVRAAERLLPGGSQTELLLLIDQFEELFTLVEDEEARANFLECLLMAVLDPRSRLRVVITMRADFIDRLLQYVDFGELLKQRLALVVPLTPDELTRAISRPVERLGMNLAPELVATILRDVGDQPGMLPLLQYALTELFTQRRGPILTLENYRATGGVTGALARRADEIIDALEPAGQEGARQIFLRLITLGEGVEDTRRRVLLAELDSLVPADLISAAPLLQPDASIQPFDVRALLAAFGRYRLLTFDHHPLTRGPTVEVAHEALLRVWPRLRGWLQESRDDLRRQQELAAAAQNWRANQQDDSYLLRGSRLAGFEAWVETTRVSLTTGELAFLQTSMAERDALRAAEEARRQRELETVRKLASTERERAEAQASVAATLRQRALILAATLFVTVVLALGVAFFARSANQNADLAATREAETALQRDLAQTSERAALEAYSLSLAANARQALAADDQPLALLLALAANSVDQPPLTAWRTLVDIAYAPAESAHWVHDRSLKGLAVSPDGGSFLTGSDDGLVLVWDAESGEIRQRLAGHEGSVLAVAVSPDGRRALSGAVDRTVVLWDLESGEILQRLVGHKGAVSGVVFTPDGERAVTSEDTSAAPADLIVWELTSGRMLRRFGGNSAGNQEGILSLALSPDGRQALVGQFSFADNNARQTVLWDVESGELIQVLPGFDRTVAGVAISPDGRYGLGAAADGALYQWELATGTLVRRLEGHEGAVEAVAVSPDGRSALSASLDQTLIWWDMETGKMIHRLHSGDGKIQTVRFIDDSRAVTAGVDGTLRIWALTSGWQLARWGKGGTGHLMPAPGTENRGIGLAISPDGRRALSGGNDPDHSAILWDYETGRPLRRLMGHEGGIFDIAFTPDGQQALTAGQDGVLILWDLATGEALRRLEGHQGSVNSVEISSDGRRALSGGLGGVVIHWDLISGEILQRLIGHFEGRGVYDVAFFPGEQQAVSSAWDGTMIVWDLVQGEQTQRLTGLEGDAGTHFTAEGDWGIAGLSLSPDGRRLLSAGRDESILLWDVATGRSLRRWTGHSGFVVDVAFTPDGRTALSTGRNDPLILWDVATGVPLRWLPLNDRLNSSFRPTLAIAPDGETALSSEADGTILKWQLVEPEPAALLDWLAANRHLRELTCAERETYGIEPLCVDGAPVATSADLLAAVRLVARGMAAGSPAPVSPATIPPPARPLSARLGHVAALGENQGELARHQFDVWSYEGKAGEVLQFQMVAGRPIDDVTIPLENRFEAGVLDTLLFVIAPDGTLLAKGNDDVALDGTQRSDANIEAIVLPADGTYRIEARSFLDDGAGPYTLRIASRAYTVDPALMREYEGEYLEGSWEYHVTAAVEDGVFYLTAAEAAVKLPLIPISDVEFIDAEGSRILFTRDATGAVNGYRLWVSMVHEIGGQWYDAVRLK